MPDTLHWPNTSTIHTHGLHIDPSGIVRIEWVGGWVGGWVEEEKAVRMRYCTTPSPPTPPPQPTHLSLSHRRTIFFARWLQERKSYPSITYEATTSRVPFTTIPTTTVAPPSKWPAACQVGNPRTHPPTHLSTCSPGSPSISFIHSLIYLPADSSTHPPTHFPTHPGALLIDHPPTHPLPPLLSSTRDLVCLLQHVNAVAGTFRNYNYIAD